MVDYEKNYLSKRPPELCNMCGNCCRVATASEDYETIKRRKEAGDQSAIDFLEIFEPFESIDEARKVNSDIVDNVIERYKQDNKSIENLTFYTCKYLKDDNLCAIYDKRKDLCKIFPSSPWAIVPPNCGFESWLFLKREETKQKIRKLKEELIELKLLRTKVQEATMLDKITSVEEKINGIILSYKQHGSEDW